MTNSILLTCHLIPAFSATATGAWIISRPKGTAPHKRLGKLWIALMLATALTSFGMTGGPLAVFAGYSYIHLLSLITLFTLPLAVWAIRRQYQALHKTLMVGLYIALCLTGILALLMKGRFLNELVF